MQQHLDYIFQAQIEFVQDFLLQHKSQHCDLHVLNFQQLMLFLVVRKTE